MRKFIAIRRIGASTTLPLGNHILMGISTDNNLRRKPLRTLGDDPPDSATESQCYVLGGTHLGVLVAERLQTAGRPVSLIDETHDPAEIPGVRGDPGDVRVLDDAGVTDAAMVVVATRDDGRNLLIAQLVRTTFGVSDVHVLVNRPDRTEVIAAAGHDPVCATTVLADAVRDRVHQQRHELADRA